MKGTIIAICLMLASFGILASCSNDDEGRGDAGVSRWDDTEAFVINMPDWFMNVAVKCDPAGFRIYAHTRQGPPVILPDDSCKGRTGIPPVYMTEGKVPPAGALDDEEG